MQRKKRTGIMLLICLIALLAFPATANAAVKINKSSALLVKGNTCNLKITGTNKKIKWSTSNKKIATVSAAGKVKAVKAGSCTITGKVGSKKYSCKVTVTNVDYVSLYKNFLSANTRNCSCFYVLNVDKKGVPELITLTRQATSFSEYSVYTVKNNKVTLLGTYTGRAQGSFIWYVSKYKALESGGWINGVGGTYTNMSVISGGKLVYKYHEREYTWPSKKYFIGKTSDTAKEVSKSAAQKYYNKYMKNYKKYKMLTNTAANRNKIG